MESQARSTTGKNESKNESNWAQFHLRLPFELLRGVTARALGNKRSTSSEILYLLERNMMPINLPEEAELDISSETVFSDRRIIAKYLAAIAEHEAKAAKSTGPKRGAHNAHVTKNQKNLLRAEGHLLYHLFWLNTYKPDVYKAVKGELS